MLKTKNLDKIDWSSLSFNKNAIKLLEQNQNKINWNNLSNNPKFKRSFFSITVVFLILSSFILFINFEKKKNSEIKYAIIYDKEIEVWSEPNNISELKFLLHEGTKVKLIDVIEDWLNIQLENGTIGWIQSSSLRILD